MSSFTASFIVALTMVLLQLFVPAATATEPTTSIPLDQVWAENMPGTKDIRKLLAGDNEQFDRALSTPARQDNSNANVGFVISGSAHDVLSQAISVLEGRTKTQTVFSPNAELWLVFSSRRSSQYVNLVAIAVKGHSIEVQYCFVPHRTKEVTSHVALIPLGNLPTGKYQVSFVPVAAPKGRTNLTLPPPASKDIQRIICQPFSFTIVNSDGK